MSRHLLFLAFALTTVGPVQAGNWPQWRGPYFNGSTEEKNLPSSWTKTENIAWTADLPGAAASTPIIWENRVFLSGVDSAKEVLQAVCFDRTTGKLLWKEDVAVWKDELTRGIRKDRQSNYASSSPVTDGKAAIFFYGNGDLICFDMIGRRRWERNIQKDYGPFAIPTGPSAPAPLLYEGKLYLQVLQRDVPVPDADWQTRRTSPIFWPWILKPARPLVLRAAERSGRGIARGVHYADSAGIRGSQRADPRRRQRPDRPRPRTGEKLWRWAGIPGGSPTGDWYLLRSPAMASFWSPLPSGTRCMPSAAGGSGPLDERAVAWNSRQARDVSSDVPTPAFYDGDFFVLNDGRKCLSRVEPRTGKVKWTVPTPGMAKYEASPLAADGRSTPSISTDRWL